MQPLDVTLAFATTWLGTRYWEQFSDHVFGEEGTTFFFTKFLENHLLKNNGLFEENLGEEQSYSLAKYKDAKTSVKFMGNEADTVNAMWRSLVNQTKHIK
jgi:hypothetical protein